MASSPPRPLPVSETPARRQRRPAVIGLGIALAALGALGAVTLVDQAGNRVSVLALAHAVPTGETIEASDLTVAQVAPDPALDPIPVARKSSVLGKTAASDLQPGTLLTTSAVRAQHSLTAGKDVVGILAKPGQLPAQRLQPGDEVTIVFTPEETADRPSGTPDTITAVVSRVGEPDANGARVVDVAASTTDSSALASWAAGGHVAIVLKATN